MKFHFQCACEASELLPVAMYALQGCICYVMLPTMYFHLLYNYVIVSYSMPRSAVSDLLFTRV